MSTLAEVLRDPARLDGWLVVGVLVAARVAPLTVLVPWMTLQGSPALVRAALVLALTAALAPLAAGALDAGTLAQAGPLQLAAFGLREVLVGGIFAVAAALPFWALDWAGRLVDTWRGASLVEVLTPDGERTSPLGQLHLLLGVVLFFSLGGHRLAFAAFGEGLVVAPPGAVDLAASAETFALGVARLTAAALAFAAALAAPAAAAIVVVEVGLGLVARSAPQIPVFFAGMPLRAAVGLAAVLLGLSILVGELPAAFEETYALLGRWMRALSP